MVRSMFNKLPADVMSTKEMKENIERVTMKDPEHLKRWLESRGSSYLILKSKDLVDALKNAGEGLLHFQWGMDMYNQFRSMQQTGDYTFEKDNLTGEHIKVPIMKTDKLTKEELDRCIRQMVGEILSMDPNWDINKDPL